MSISSLLSKASSDQNQETIKWHIEKNEYFYCLFPSTDHFFLTLADTNAVKPKKLGDNMTEAFPKHSPSQSPVGNYVVLYAPEVNFHYFR